MGRYRNAILSRDNIGNRIFNSYLYPKIKKSNNDIYIISKNTDRLDTLAYEFYGDSTMWWIIAQANNIKGSLNIESGKQIRIPADLSNFYTDLDSINGSR